jgi:hypothetical protein
MHIAQADGGAAVQVGGGQAVLRGIDHVRRHLNTQVAAAGRAQQVSSEGRVARADLQHLFARGDGQQGDGRLVQRAVAAVHGLGYSQCIVPMRVAQLGGEMFG